MKSNFLPIKTDLTFLDVNAKDVSCKVTMTWRLKCLQEYWKKINTSRKKLYQNDEWQWKCKDQ